MVYNHKILSPLPKWWDGSQRAWESFWKREIKKISTKTVTASRSNMGIDLSGTSKWQGAVVGLDGNIYCIPNYESNILIIDPKNETATKTNMGESLIGTNQYMGGVLAPNGKIYAAPYQSNTILIIDPSNDTAVQSTMGANLSVSGGGKYQGSALGIDGKIYCVPYSDGNGDILIIDPITGVATRSTMGGNIPAGNRFFGAVNGGDGKIYAIPRAPNGFLIIDPITGVATFSNFGVDFSEDKKFMGGVLAPNGKIYVIPRDSTTIGIINTGIGLKNMVLSPYLNKWQEINMTTITISADPNKYEAWPNIIQLASGELQVYYRTNDVNTHGFEPSGKQVMRRSSDNGLTWNESLVCTDIPNQPSEPTLLETKTNGRYQGGLTIITRLNLGSNYKIFRSTDYGETWDNGTILNTLNYYDKQPHLARITPEMIMFSHGDANYNIIAEVSVDEGLNWVPFNVGICPSEGAYPESLLIRNTRTLAVVWCSNQHSPVVSDVFVNLIDFTPIAKLLPYSYRTRSNNRTYQTRTHSTRNF